MRKSTLFISAVLTTFMLAILVGVVSAYKSTLDTSGVTDAQQDPTAMALETIPTAGAFLTPEQAAALAAQVIGRTDLYSVETALYNEVVSAYLVTFTSGDIVYVSLDGQILSIGKLAPTYVSAPPAPVNNNEKHKRPRPTPPPGGGGGEEEEEEED